MLITDSQLSLSNHYSGPTADGRWVKIAHSTEDWATEAVIYDGMVQEFLGRNVQFIVHDNKAGFITPNLGVPYFGICAREMLDIAAAINEVHAPMWVNNTHDYKDTLVSRVHRRYGDSSQRCLEWSLGFFETMDFTSLSGEYLVHTDLNPKNIVIDPASTVVSVIDWESAVKASPDMELAHLARGLLMRSENDSAPVGGASRHAAITSEEAEMILGRVHDTTAFVTALVSKIVSSASWVFKHECEVNPRTRHDVGFAEHAVEDFVDSCNHGLSHLGVRIPTPFE